MTNESGPLTNHDESESGLSDTPPGHRAGSPSLLTLMGPTPKSAAGFRRADGLRAAIRKVRAGA
jgi:hypothetical protein